jgi:Mce-associated membrane protein
MADTGKPPQDSAASKSDALALAEQAEAEAAEAEALAAAARARAVAIKLRREAQALADKEAADEEAAQTTAPDATADVPETTEEPELPEPPETPETPEPSDDAEPATTASERRVSRFFLPLIAAAVVAICALLGVSGWMVWQHHNVLQERQRSAAFVAAARQGVINLTSLDFKRAKEDVQRVLDSATGQFRDDFQKRAEDFASVVKDSKAVTEGSVAATAVESMDKDSAVVLVLGNERVTNLAGAKDAPRIFRFRVTVAHDGDELKVSKVEFVV